MVKTQKDDNSKSIGNQEKKGCTGEANKIGASTKYEYCSEQMSPFGGLLGVVKFLDLVKFKEIFYKFYNSPTRTPALGHYYMVYGFIMLLFIGFNRVWHFIYIQLDAMLCSIFNVCKLPHVTTYWRYMDSLGINEGKSLLEVMSALRERVWHLCDICHEVIHINLDTTVETIYGNQQGGRKGHNTKNRGKKGYRPVLCFIEETREYLAGKLRKGETISGEEVADLIRTFKKYLPGCVKKVILRGDGEFISWESIKAAIDEGYDFVIGNKVCNPPFESTKWYKIKPADEIEYNECIYKPIGWERVCRFVAMRIPKEKPSEGDSTQLELFDDSRYTYRVFVTNLNRKAEKVILEYDQRADCENLIGEAKREGLAAIPSHKFANNYAYFQIVMLAYNIWRSFKMLAGHRLMEEKRDEAEMEQERAKNAAKEIIDNNIRIARLKLLIIAAKITSHGNTNKVKYSEHDSRVTGLFDFYKYLDKRRAESRPWLDGKRWICKHLFSFGDANIQAVPT